MTLEHTVMARVLLVEDNPKIASFVGKGLNEAGYAVRHISNGLEASETIEPGDAELAVIDIMLPGLDGISLIKRLRARGCSFPIIILTARRDVEDRVIGLQEGGDDYLVKPFSFAELLARIGALLRRVRGVSAPRELVVGDLSIDVVTRTVRRGRRRIDLQPREYDLLIYLVENAGKIVSRAMIIEHVWNFNFDPGTNIVDARVCKLRDKIDRHSDTKLIHTIRGAGYVVRAAD